jgi:peroxiredoxin
MGITRATFIIDGKGVLVQIFDKVKPEGHAAEVLDWFMK